MKSIFVPFGNSPDGPRDIWLECSTYIDREGFGTRASVYPMTICKARYNGTYEGAPWLAFPVAPHILAREEWRDWSGSDIECMQWYSRSVDEKWPLGRGHSPDLAYQGLVELVAVKAGISLEEWMQEPTWDRDELKRRDGQDPAL